MSDPSVVHTRRDTITKLLTGVCLRIYTQTGPPPRSNGCCVEKCACARVTPHPPRPHTFAHQSPQPARTISPGLRTQMSHHACSPRRNTVPRACIRTHPYDARDAGSTTQEHHAGEPSVLRAQVGRTALRKVIDLEAWAVARLHGFPMSAKGGRTAPGPSLEHPGQAPENRAQQVVVGRASVCVCMSVGASTCVCVCVRVRGWCDYVRAFAPQNSLLIHQKAQTYHPGGVRFQQGPAPLSVPQVTTSATCRFDYSSRPLIRRKSMP